MSVQMHASLLTYVYVCSLPASCVEIHSHGCSANYNSLIVKSELRGVNMGTRFVHAWHGHAPSDS